MVEKLLLSSILLFAAVISFYRLSELMPFIGDQGWFYLSARDALLTGEIPLVGIASSHPWLHQGPLWTYLLAFVLWIFHFNPLSGGYLSILFSLGSVYLIYLVGKHMFTASIGLYAAVLYATSPLVIIHARMPYHTSPIPFFTLLFLLSFFRWVKGETRYFPLIILSLTLLYNFELATIIYTFLFLCIFLYGVLKKARFVKDLRNKQVILFSCLAFILPMLPILLYDLQHGFPQTLGFAAWLGYKLLTTFGFPSLRPDTTNSSYLSVITFFFQQYQTLIFLPHFFISLLIFTCSTGWLAIRLFNEYQKKNLRREYVLLSLSLMGGILGFFAAKTTSDAYLLLLFPSLILSVAVFFHEFLAKKLGRVLTTSLILGIGILNITSLLSHNYLMGIEKKGFGPFFSERIAAAQYIVNEAQKNEYTIKIVGGGSEFESSTMNYQYLTWWLGRGPSKQRERLQFIITDMPDKVYVEKKENSK